MKNIILTTFLVAQFVLPSVSAASVVTQNASGITIVFFNDQGQSVAQEVLMSAISLKGVKYKYGGNSPETGFDCSGFVNYVYSQAASLKLPRTTRAISKVGHHIKKSELQAGDLVFFNTLRSAYSHVGIYIGNNDFIHAPRTGSFVRIESMKTRYWATRFNGAKRLVPSEQIASNTRQ